MEYVIESKEGGLLEGILMPFDVYNDAADRALRALKQRFLYDEIEAEVSSLKGCLNLLRVATYINEHTSSS